MNELWQTLSTEFIKTFIRDNRWKLFVEGFEHTIVITIFAALLGICIGTVICVVHALAENQKGKRKTFRSYVLSVLDWFGSAYVAVLRGTPMALQLTITAFIIMAGYSNKIVVCIMAFGFNSGAYVSEVIRGGIESVDIGQTEAGRSLGFSSLTTLRLIVLPQAIKSILPALCNEGIAVLKETSIVGLISVVDLTRASDLVRSRTLSPYFPLISVAVVYFILVYGLSYAVTRLERRMKRSDRH